MKKDRHSKITEIITDHCIDTQDSLIAYLRNSGYDVTQATVSRDIRELKLTKVTLSDGTYRYVMPAVQHAFSGKPISRSLLDTVEKVDYAQNTVVLKTSPGMAQAVAVGIDKQQSDDVLGCVAGDDTILVITRDNEHAKIIAEQILSVIHPVK